MPELVAPQQYVVSGNCVGVTFQIRGLQARAVLGTQPPDPEHRAAAAVAAGARMRLSRPPCSRDLVLRMEARPAALDTSTDEALLLRQDCRMLRLR
jgi:hypothetical protein